jgi:two-component system phosphate regulon response regulator PhoB
MTSKVLVIEDDDDVADVIRRSLSGNGIACTVAPSSAVATALLSAGLRPDVILLDLDLPDAFGLDLLPELRTVAPVIVLTGRRSEDTIVEGLSLGAEDYVTKPFSPRVLAARVEVAMRRGRGEARGRIEHGALAIDLERREVTLDGDAVDLTRRELDLLAYLADRPNSVIPRDELLTSVWESSAEWQTPATVTEHVRRVRLKLGDPGWIESVRGIGYRFHPVA